jgi:protein-glutamine gamma-glutamyltransferase
MISISGNMIEHDAFVAQHNLEPLEKRILDILSSSNEIYWYDYESQLIFELRLRRNIVKASADLYRTRFSFRVFRKSMCNEDYWERTDEGGFRLKEGIPPISAIRDIYVHSNRYGNECATAMVIVFYKALSDTFPEELFNKVFSKIYLMNWEYLDNTLGIRNTRNIKDFLPGDCRYFKNPDVDPLTPEWQGENAIDMGNGMYYGHGIGIKSADAIIRDLNDQRREGADTSAYLMDSATRLGYKRLADIYEKFV